ncbi:MAG TPA: pyridoxal phosphate-dependent aminotransferase [Bacillota bacterium]|nr:pyridoxal phosphate-dependent aminotransferase [Bacillota bacterium]
MISKSITEKLKNSSWIRQMFEQGEMLRKAYGSDKVYDFSLGNPEVEPPSGVKQSLRKFALDDTPGQHRYMSNAGFADVRATISNHIKMKSGIELSPDNIIMTCGAAGGLNVVLKTILDPGDEVIILSPYFAEYLSYIDNHGGVPIISPCLLNSFEPDLHDIGLKLSPKTKAIILNSPNNPTGVVYSKETLEKMAKLLADMEKKYGNEILVISDEPYADIVYDGVKVPHILEIFKHSIVVNSFSKSLALPGERIGYVAINNTIQNDRLLVQGIVYSNRILGFVNAPGLFQRVIADSISASLDIDYYKQRRDLLYKHLTGLGYECNKPQGAFYLFPKALIDDDVEFVRRAAKHNVLLVPGSGFGCPSYFRISYCVSLQTIEKSLPLFETIKKEFD